MVPRIVKPGTWVKGACMYCREFSSIIDPTIPADPLLAESVGSKDADVTTRWDLVSATGSAVDEELHQ